MKEIHIGTSGWSYAHWDTVFYPCNISSNQHLKFYSEFFNTVEINTTFYHLPLVKTVRNWHKQIPEDFIFSVKASRYITHMKKLMNCEKALQLFYSRIKYLKEKLGPILFQLPPSFAMDFQILQNFIDLLDSDYSHVFEFRHPTWYTQKIYTLLRSRNIGLCVTDLDGKLSPLKTTAKFAYVRLHGPQKAYKGSYNKEQLLKWKKQVLNWAKTKEVFLYFDNDEKSYAIKDGTALKEILLKRET